MLIKFHQFSTVHILCAKIRPRRHTPGYRSATEPDSIECYRHWKFVTCLLQLHNASVCMSAKQFWFLKTAAAAVPHNQPANWPFHINMNRNFANPNPTWTSVQITIDWIELTTKPLIHIFFPSQYFCKLKFPFGISTLGLRLGWISCSMEFPQLYQYWQWNRMIHHHRAQ